MLFSLVTATLWLATIVISQSVIPVCLTSCISQSCTDITHLNCVCLQNAANIQNCVSQLCNSNDQTLAQQTLAQTCFNTTSSASAAAALSTSTLVVVYSLTSGSITSGSHQSTLSSSFSVSASVDSVTSAAASSTSAAPAPVFTTTAITSQTAAVSSSGLSSAAKGGIIGGVIGGVVLFGSAAIIGFILYRRRARRESDNTILPYEKISGGIKAIQYPDPDDMGSTEVGGRLNGSNVNHLAS